MTAQLSPADLLTPVGTGVTRTALQWAEMARECDACASDSTLRSGDPEIYAALLAARTEFERVGRLSMAAYRAWVKSGYRREGPEFEAHGAGLEAYRIAGEAHEAARTAWCATLPPARLDTNQSRRAEARGQLSLF